MLAVPPTSPGYAIPLGPDLDTVPITELFCGALTSTAELPREVAVLPGAQRVLLQPLAGPRDVRALSIVQPAVGPHLQDQQLCSRCLP